MRLHRQRLIHNAIVFAGAEGIWGFQAALIAPATFFSLLLAHYGAGKILIGSIAAIESGGILLSQILGLLWFRSIRHRKRNLVGWHAGVVIPLLGVMAGWVAWGGLSPMGMAYGLWMLLALNMVTLGIVVAVWSEWVASLFPVALRGRLMGVSLCSFSVAGALGALAAGRILRVYPGPMGFALCLALAAGVAWLSMWGYAQVRDPAEEEPEREAVVEFRAIAAKFMHSLSDSNFRYFLGARLLTVLGFAMVPLVAVYYSRPENGGLSPSTLVSCGAIMTGGLAAGNLGLGYLGDRKGHRYGLLVGIACQIIALAVLLGVPGLAGCLIFYFFAGISNASGWISHYNLLFESCPHDHLGAHITIGNLALGTVGLTAPILAGVVAEMGGLVFLFTLSAIISLAALVWLWILVRDPRDRRTATAGSGMRP